MNTPTREAVAIGVATGLPVLDLDPVDLPTERGGRYADVYADALLAIQDGMDQFHIETGRRLWLVWSDTREAVHGLCPKCDHAFNVNLGKLTIVAGEPSFVCCTVC